LRGGSASSLCWKKREPSMVNRKKRWEARKKGEGGVTMGLCKNGKRKNGHLRKERKKLLGGKLQKKHTNGIKGKKKISGKQKQRASGHARQERKGTHNDLQTDDGSPS